MCDTKYIHVLYSCIPFTPTNMYMIIPMRSRQICAFYQGPAIRLLSLGIYMPQIT